MALPGARRQIREVAGDYQGLGAQGERTIGDIDAIAVRQQPIGYHKTIACRA